MRVIISNYPKKPALVSSVSFTLFTQNVGKSGNFIPESVDILLKTPKDLSLDIQR